MTEGVDYSTSRPDPHRLYAEGKRFVVRYVGSSILNPKTLSPAEADRLRAAGLEPVAACELTRGWLYDPDISGAAVAGGAYAQARDCGMPEDRPIYFALDVDPASLQPSQWLAVQRTLDDAAGEIGWDQVGIYGGYQAIEYMVVRAEAARWGWQTYGWSHGLWHPKAQLQQYRNGVILAGGMVDLCRATTPDYGQWGYRPDPLPHHQEVIDMHMIHRASGSGGVLAVNGAGVVLVSSKADLAAYKAAGVPLIPVSDPEFSRYEKLRADIPHTS